MAGTLCQNLPEGFGTVLTRMKAEELIFGTAANALESE
jgi:hypothetical protein